MCTSFSIVQGHCIEKATILQKKDLLAKTGQTEGKCATRDRKGVQVSTKKLPYKLWFLFFERYLPRFCSIYVSLFRTQYNSISNWMYLIFDLIVSITRNQA